MKSIIYRQAAIDALGEEPYLWEDDDEFVLGQRNQWNCDVNALKALPSAQPEVRTNANGDWVILNKDKILKAGVEGREVEFRIGGRLFAIREKAQ